MDLRPRHHINWRLLHEGEVTESEIQQNFSVQPLPGNYQVARLVWKRQLSQQESTYLVEWEGYHPEEATWEPAHHLSRYLLATYNSPVISQQRLRDCADLLEAAIGTRLRSQNARFSVTFPLDVYRYVFGHIENSSDSIYCDKHDFERLCMTSHWWYRVDKNGQGNMVVFPIRLKPRLYRQKKWVSKTGELKQVKRVKESLLFYVLTSACDMMSL